MGTKDKKKNAKIVDTSYPAVYNIKQSFTLNAVKDRSKHYSFYREPDLLETGKR